MMTRYIAHTLSLVAAVGLLGCSGQSNSAPAASGSGADKVPGATATTPAANLATATNVFAPPVAPPLPVLDPTTVVAMVDGASITEAEIQKDLLAQKARLRLDTLPPEGAAEQIRMLRSQVLSNVVMKKVLMQAVDAQKITVSDAEIDQAIGQLKAELPPDRKLEDVLGQGGTTMEQFREGFAVNLKVKKLVDAHIAATNAPSDEDITKFYEDNKGRYFEQKDPMVQASHILVKVEEGAAPADKDAAKKKIDGLRDRAAKGEDFAKLAQENSDCPSKDKGGDLGKFGRGQMVKPFEDAAFTQKIGDVGPVIETQFGYHIIKVTERTEARTIPMAEVKEKITQFLSNEKKQKAAQSYLEELRAKAKVEFPATDAKKT